MARCGVHVGERDRRALTSEIGWNCQHACMAESGAKVRREEVTWLVVVGCALHCVVGSEPLNIEGVRLSR